MGVTVNVAGGKQEVKQLTCINRKEDQYETAFLTMKKQNRSYFKEYRNAICLQWVESLMAKLDVSRENDPQ